MFIHQSRLPHVLPPRLYHCPQQHDRELTHLFRPGWQCVGTVANARTSGSFFTTTRLGKPLLVRQEAGVFHTFLNVCPHRHSLLSSATHGCSEKLTCQYHGWQFDCDGRSARIPDAQSFRPIPGGPEPLQKFPTEVRGPLIFAALEPTSITLSEQLGPLEFGCAEFPATRWHRADSWSYDFAANWKLVAENTVESYHVESVHPRTLVRATSPERTEHEIHPQGTIMRADVVAPALYYRLADWVLPRLQPGCTHRYHLYHAFPGLFLIRIDAMLQVMNLIPTSPHTSAMRVDVFVLKAARETFFTRQMTRQWGRLKCWIIKKILAEDAALYPDMHQGMLASPFHGTISTREELVWAFQQYVATRCQLAPAPAD